MADLIASCTGAFVEVPSSSETGHEGFIVSKVNGVPEYHWIRVQGVDPRTGSPAHARLNASPSLEQLLGGSGALAQVCSRLRSAPSVHHFLVDLQEVLERLAYGSTAGPGPGSRGARGRGGGSSSISSSRVMQLLLRDLDEVGWNSLEELDQDAAHMTLVHVDEHGREHRLRLTLPYDYPASAPAAATDLPRPFHFTWRPPMPPPQQSPTESRPRPRQGFCSSGRCGGGGGNGGSDCWTAPAGVQEGAAWISADVQHQQQQHRQQQHQQLGACGNVDGGRSGGANAAGCGGGCSSLADVFRAFKLAVSTYQSLWCCLDLLDCRTRVLDPPLTVSASRRHVGPPTRRVALGSAVSLQLRLDPTDPLGPPPPGGLTFLGPPEAVAQLREGFFGRLHLWDRDSDPVENLEVLLGQPLPAPQGTRGGGGGAGRNHPAWPRSDAANIKVTGAAVEADEEGEGQDSEPQQPMAECPICMMHLLPLDDDDDDDGYGDDGRSGGEKAMNQNTDVDGAGVFPASAGGGGGALRGLVPDVVCPTPACGLAFHTPCLAEWLRSLPDTRVSFSKLFGRCPFCSNPITVRA